MPEVTATLVVSFDEKEVSVTGVSGLLTAEIDDRATGLNLGRTRFIPGDKIGYLVYKNSQVGALQHVSSLGTIENLGTQVEKQVTETLIFSRSNSADTRFPVKKNFSSRWLGKSGGGVSVVNERSVQVANPVTAVLEVTYTTIFSEHRVINIPTVVNGKTAFPLVVTITG